MDKEDERREIRFARLERGLPPIDPNHKAGAEQSKKPTGDDHITEVERKFNEEIAKGHFNRLMLFAPEGLPPAKLERVREVLKKNLSHERDPDKEEGVRMALRAINQRLLEHSQARAPESEPKPKTSLENVKRLFSFQRKQPPEGREPMQPRRPRPP